MSDRNELRKKIEEYTGFIRERLNLSSPLNMIEVANRLGVTCNPVENVDYDAKLSKNGETYHIDYNKNQIFERQQFSIARELGHLLLHEFNKDVSKDVYYRRHGNISQAEWEANEFAATLLMPSEEFISCCIYNADDSGMVDLYQVAKKFAVSKQAAAVRGSVLKLWMM